MVVTRLPVVFCILLDFSESNDTLGECEHFANGTVNTENCFNCDVECQYFFSGRTAHIICMVLWVLVVVTGIFGTLANCLLISVLRKRVRPTSFDQLLCILACIDLSNCAASMLYATGLISYFETWQRGLFTLIYYHVGVLIITFGKSTSAYLTVFITIERYLVIASPLNSRLWLTRKRAKVTVSLILLLTFLFNIPRITSLWIRYNENGRNVPSLAGHDYIISQTIFDPFWHNRLTPIHYLDGFATFPILLICNLLLYTKISRFTRMRQRLTNSQKLDIQTARMFVAVVAVLLFCNTVTTAFYILLLFYQKTYKEMWQGVLLSIALNSAVNMPIYYVRSWSFRQEINCLLPGWLKPLPGKSSHETEIALRTQLNA